MPVPGITKIGTSPAHRRQIIGNLLSNLIEHDRITTTPSKAKVVAPLMDKLISMAKKGSIGGLARAKQDLYNEEVTVPKLYTTLKDRYANRDGGYTRIILNGKTRGDQAPSAILELIDAPGDFKFELTARELGRKVFEEEISTGQQLPIMNQKILAEYKNYHLNRKIKQLFAHRTPEAKQEFIEKAEAFREILRSESPVYGGMARRDVEKFKNEPMRQSETDRDMPEKPTNAVEGDAAWKKYERAIHKADLESARVDLNVTTPMVGRVHRVGELLPAMAVETPRKPVPFADRHLWARKPAHTGGRGGFLDTWPTDEDGNEDKSGRPLSSEGVGYGESSKVGGVDGVPEGEGWQNGGNGEYELARSPIGIAKGALGKKRVPVPRLERGRDGMGG